MPAIRRKSDVKRRKILDAAEELFLTQGFDKTSMDMVADRAAVSKPTVYSHFNSKEELFAAVVGGKCPSEALPEEFFDPTVDCREALIRLGRFAVTLLLSPETIRVYRLCVDAAEKHPELSRRFFHSGPDRFIRRLARYFEELTAAGVLRVDRPRLAAAQLLICFRGEAGLRLELNVPLDEEQEDADSHIARCVDLFLGYYGI